MARSKEARRKRPSRLVIAIPLIALAVIGAAYAASIVPPSTPSVAMDFTAKLLIAESNNSTTNQAQRYWAPTIPVGMPGGIWATHQYDSYGVGGNYPVYLDNPFYNCPSQAACLFHVKSNVVHAYTLGDFLAVAGYPVVSQNDTLGLKRNGNFAWQLCVGPTGQAAPNFQWGSMVIQANMDITLLYYDTVNGFGCA